MTKLPTKKQLEQAIEYFEENTMDAKYSNLSACEAVIDEDWLDDEYEQINDGVEKLEELVIQARVTCHYDTDGRSETFYNCEYPFKRIEDFIK